MIARRAIQNGHRWLLLFLLPESPWRLCQIRRAHAADGPAACVAALQACASRRDVSRGVAIHACTVVRGFFHQSPSLVTSLITFYSKCGLPGDALAVFRRVAANVFQWNAAIAGMSTNGLPREALTLFLEMEASGLSPDEFTFPGAIAACADLFLCSERRRSLELRSLHCRLTKAALQSDLFVSSALVNGYMRRADSMDYAARVFERLPLRDVVIWNSMVNGLAQGGRPADALRFFQRMAAEGVAPSKFTVTGVVSAFSAMGNLAGGRTMHSLVEKSGHAAADVAISNSLIDLYGKCGGAEEAGRIFALMPERDLLSWNSMISNLVQSGDHGGALRLFDLMRRGAGVVLPDAVTASAVLPACAHAAALMRGRKLHGFLVAGGLLRRHGGDVFLHNAVMDMYAKCGSLDDAMAIFDRMPARDVASWNIIIGGYAAHGRAQEALRLFSRMSEENEAAPPPDEVTLVAALSACNHGGLVEEGRELLRRMEPEFGVRPAVEHYACAVDMLGRAGLLAEAQELAAGAPSPVVWRAYLAACRMHGATEQAAAAAERVLEMEPEHCGSYVLLSNAYGSAGRHREVSAIRSSMRVRHVRKTPGCSWVELGAELHVFVTGDRTHVTAVAIYDLLAALAGPLRECGYLPLPDGAVTVR